jgi:hypothetical protein
VGPVFLLDVGIVVLLVGTAAGELNPMGLAVAKEVAVDELDTVIGVQALQREGQGRGDLLQGPVDAALALSQGCTSLGPGGGDVGKVQRVDVRAIGSAPAVVDQIDLAKPWRRDVPAVGFEFTWPNSCGLRTRMSGEPDTKKAG